jgi:hypothetical protein
VRFVVVFGIPESAKQAAVADISSWLAGGELRHRIAERHPLTAAATAHEAVERGPRGKVLLEVSDGSAAEPSPPEREAGPPAPDEPAGRLEPADEETVTPVRDEGVFAPDEGTSAPNGEFAAPDRPVSIPDERTPTPDEEVPAPPEPTGEGPDGPAPGDEDRGSSRSQD